MVEIKPRNGFKRQWRGRALLCGVALIALAGGALPGFAQAVKAAAREEVAAPAKGAVAILDKAQIDALLAAPDKVVFIDVRRADEIAAIGGVPAFLNIQNSELDRFVAYIPRDRQIVTLSNHAARGQVAARLLKARGFNVVGTFGAQNYEEQGGTLYGRKYTTPAIAGVVAADTRVEVLREGFEGTEGPVALSDGSVLFTENRADRIVKLAPDGAISTYLDKTGGANALAANAAGKLVAAETARPSIAVLEPPKVLVAKYKGHQLNRPNDLALARAGSIYFSDPGVTPPTGTTGAKPPTPALYWLDRHGKLNLVADDIRRPNGVALSPDEKTLYVANTAGEHVIAFTLKADGAPADRRDFAKIAAFKQTPGGPTSGADGIAIDEAGRVYVATTAGVEIFSPQGAPLGTIELPKKPQNLAFGGADRSKLYVVGSGSVFRVATLTHGVNRPGK